MCKVFDWKRSRIYILEVEAVPQSCIPYVQIGLRIVLYMRCSLLVESFLIPFYLQTLQIHSANGVKLLEA
jgi:hypothetical protein